MATLRKIGYAYRIDDEYRDGYVILTSDEMNKIIAEYLSECECHVPKWKRTEALDQSVHMQWELPDSMAFWKYT